VKPSWGQYSAPTRLYILLVIVAGWAVLLASLRLYPIGSTAPDMLALLLFLGLAVFGEFNEIELGKGGKLAMGTIVHVCCMIIFSPPISAAIAGFGMAVDQMIRHKPLHKLLFNSSKMLLSVGIPAIILWLIHPQSPLSLPPDLLYLSPALIALGCILYYVIDTFILSGVTAFLNRSSVVGIWLANERVFLLPELSAATVGALAAVTWTFEPMFVVLLALPAMTIHGAYRRVNETEKANALLDQTIRELHVTLEELNSTYDATLHSLVKALDTRDTETESHSMRVVAYARTIAEAMGLTAAELEAISRGALLHDVGKIGIPDAVLRKPGPLTPAEWAEMRRHPALGFRMLAGIGFLKEANQLVLQHHERYDGKGYPLGLSGNQIDLGARIFAVADTLDAMTSDRPYRRALSWETAYEELERCAGTQFDPEVVEAAQRVFSLLRAIGQTTAPNESGISQGALFELAASRSA